MTPKISSPRPEGRIWSIVLDRWSDPDRTGTWARHPFGGEITGYRCFAGLTIPSAGRLGWHFGTDRWAAGKCFRDEITTLDAPSVPDKFVPHRRSG